MPLAVRYSDFRYSIKSPFSGPKPECEEAIIAIDYIVNEGHSTDPGRGASPP
jgi:hypothetical protein